MVPFVVRAAPSAPPSEILVQLPVNTWQAYNNWGGKSLYAFNSTRRKAANHVSFDRPYTDDVKWEIWNHEYPLIRFLEREGYDVSYTTDVDTDRAGGDLLEHRLVVVAGHDEYWTKAIRDAFDAARDSGTNLAFIGANIGFWQVRYEDDGRTIVAYKVAAAAAVGGSVTVAGAGWDFVSGAVGGVAIGLAAGWLIAEVRRRIDDVPVEVTISLLSGYAGYVPAEQLGFSGVLAAVTTGVYVGWQAPQISTARMRLQGAAMWEILTFLLNALLFVLIGLQLRSILDGLGGRSVGMLLGQAAAVSATVILTRIVWQNTMPYVIRALDRRPQQRERRTGWRQRMVGAWSGMRGAVSLAAALALTARFPERNLLLFLTFAVILVTLVLQGLSLPVLIRRLHIRDDGEDAREELIARRRATEAAIARLDELEAADWTYEDTVERMRNLYRYRARRLSARAGDSDDDGYETRSYRYQKVVREVLEAQRIAIVELRNNGDISNDVMHRVERELDLERERLEI
jgi:CPA1 family monovalent cation:H+ antiporter